MKSLLVNKILSTEKYSVNQIFESKSKVYTFLNPVSYLTALDNKELFGQMDGIFADGGLLVKAIKMLYAKVVTRRSFDMTSLWLQSCLLTLPSMERPSILWLLSKSRWRRPWRYSVSGIQR